MSNICKFISSKKKRNSLIGITLLLIVGLIIFNQLNKVNLLVYIDDGKQNPYSTMRYTMRTEGKNVMNAMIIKKDINHEVLRISFYSNIYLDHGERRATQDVQEYIKFKSSDESVAKVEGDSINFIRKGHVTISATYFGETIHGKQIDKEKSKLESSISIDVV